MEDKVLNIINGHNKALTYDEILERLTDEEIPLLPDVLSKLIKDLKIRYTNKGKYAKFDDKSQKIGIFAANKKGFGFVIIDGEDRDYFVSKENVLDAINGDEVVIKVDAPISVQVISGVVPEYYGGVIGKNSQTTFFLLDD